MAKRTPYRVRVVIDLVVERARHEAADYALSAAEDSVTVEPADGVKCVGIEIRVAEKMEKLDG